MPEHLVSQIAEHPNFTEALKVVIELIETPGVNIIGLLVVYDTQKRLEVAAAMHPAALNMAQKSLTKIIQQLLHKPNEEP